MTFYPQLVLASSSPYRREQLRRLGLPFPSTRNWKRSLSLTHTAVALGCIPAVLLVLLWPELLAERHDVLTQSMQAQPAPGAAKPPLLYVVAFVLLIAAWVAVVEEVLFRALIVSVVRRWNFLPRQRQRDIAAALISALLFGIAHYVTWGPIASLALIGLGLGFVLAYIANGEQLLPVVLYHFIFDVLSISVSVFA